ncbi:hypothetical protein PN36_18635 [Candidatus Thiomargarita nelsonii]|uniref:Uncharacterized protein n=1 Tax=Candidatus Thiomargarita nelsonii TaxID=1003181 RepID=A0A4E0QP94_9GAMM|nr:hypothetical protein PN36_18635 [Candidatus Thiomargarita nelsonii]
MSIFLRGKILKVQIDVDIFGKCLRGQTFLLVKDGAECVVFFNDLIESLFKLNAIKLRYLGVQDLSWASALPR